MSDAPEFNQQPLDVEAVRRRVASKDCGAVVVFLGTVRDHHGGRRVTALSYSAYRPMAERALARITGELEAGAGGSGWHP